MFRLALQKYKKNADVATQNVDYFKILFLPLAFLLVSVTSAGIFFSLIFSQNEGFWLILLQQNVAYFALWVKCESYLCFVGYNL